MAILNIYGTIVEKKFYEEDVAAAEVKKFVDSLAENEPLEVYINSYGGHVSAGLAIYNAISAHKGYTTITIEGFACSIASIIAFAGDKLVMCKSSLLMIHLPYLGIVGNKIDLAREIKALEQLESTMMSVYEQNLVNQSDKQTISDLMYAETWFAAVEAAKYFVIEIQDDKAHTNSATASNSNQHKSILNRFAKNKPSTNANTSVLANMKPKIPHPEQVAAARDRQKPSEAVQIDKTKTSLLERFKKGC